MNNNYNKKHPDLSLDIIKSLEFLSNIEGELFERTESGEDLITIIDKDLNSTFHFSIKKYNQESGKFLISRSPSSSQKNSTTSFWLPSSGLKPLFYDWCKLLVEIAEVNEPFGDKKIFEERQKEYYDYYEFVEEDDKESALSSSEAIFVHNWLEVLDERLLENKTDENASVIEDIQEDITQLKNSLTTKPKQWVVNKIAFIRAKIAIKGGVEWIKKFIGDIGTEGKKQSIKGFVEWGLEVISGS